jgi:hypothetical protein
MPADKKTAGVHVLTRWPSDVQVRLRRYLAAENLLGVLYFTAETDPEGKANFF